MGVFYCFDNGVSDAQNAPGHGAGVCCTCGAVCADCCYSNVRVSGGAAGSGNMGGVSAVYGCRAWDLFLLWIEAQSNIALTLAPACGITLI